MVSGRSGFRKSHHPLLGRYGVRRASRTPRHLLPFWKLTFVLPLSLDFFGITPGYVMAGVEVGELGFVTVTGKLKPWVEQQAIAAVRTLSPRWDGPISARLTRAAEPGPTLSGPLRPAIDRTIVLRFERGNASIVEGTAMRRVAMR